MVAHIDLDDRFVKSPSAGVDYRDFEIVWPFGGVPIALDPAASTILNCFETPASLHELSEDLVSAIGLDYNDARDMVTALTESFLATGHVLPVGLQPSTSAVFAYPPNASL